LLSRLSASTGQDSAEKKPRKKLLSAGLGGTFTYMTAAHYGYGRRGPNIIGGGFFVYFDAIYAMVSVGFSFYDWDVEAILPPIAPLDIEVLGKFPISLGRVSVFPLLGVDYKIGGFWGSEIGIKFGAGTDIPLGDILYIRPSLLYEYNFLLENHSLDIKAAIGGRF
jgi:hypothetical protein